MNNYTEKIIRLIKNPEIGLSYMSSRKMLNWLSDEYYLKIIYKYKMNKNLNLNNPMTFNEKLQWLKLNDRNPLYTRLVDKYEVRSYISTIIGDEYLIPIIGVYKNVDEIDFENLPNQFVLKCTHDSGSVVVCKNKSEINEKEIKNKMNKVLKKNYYYKWREWPYKNVKPRIICEKLLENNIIDYKIFCFNGKAKFLYVGQGLVSDHSLKIDFFDLNWNKMKFRRNDYESFEIIPNKPTKFDEMINIAEKLSYNIPFVRIDLYEVDGNIYFSEYTFTPGAGFITFEPEIQDEKLGQLLEIPSKDKKNITI